MHYQTEKESESLLLSLVNLRKVFAQFCVVPPQLLNIFINGGMKDLNEKVAGRAAALKASGVNK